MNWYMLEKLATNKVSDWECQASTHRLREELLSGQDTGHSLYAGALVSLGSWLVRKGRRLEAQHDPQALPGVGVPSAQQSTVLLSRHHY